MRAAFLPDALVLRRGGDTLEASMRSAMRTFASRRLRSTPQERRAALVQLVGCLQTLPSRTFTGEIPPLQAEVLGFLRRHRRRIARIGDLHLGSDDRALFLPLRVATMGRSRRKNYWSSLDAPLRAGRAAVPSYTDVEIECTALMALWVDAWFARDDRRFRLVESGFAPSCDPVVDVFCWTRLPEELGDDQVEILETLLADGLPITQALDICTRL